MDEQYRRDIENKVLNGKTAFTAEQEARSSYHMRINAFQQPVNYTPTPPAVDVSSYLTPTPNYRSNTTSGSSAFNRAFHWKIPLAILIVWIVGWVIVDDPLLVRRIYKGVTGQNLQAPAFLHSRR